MFCKFKGLAASCETLLLSEMSVIQTIPVILNDGSIHEDKLINNLTEPLIYKFFVPNSIISISCTVTILAPCSDCPDVSLYVQAQSLPTPKNYIQNAIIRPNQTGDVSIDFYPQVGVWHYLELNFLTDEEVGGNSSNQTKNSDPLEFSISLTFHEKDEDEIKKSLDKALPRRSFDDYPLLRQTYREFFMFDYDLLPDANGTVPMSLNITNGTPALFKFDLGDVYDVGGTLSFAVAMKHDNIAGNSIEKLVGSTAVAEKLVDQNEEDSTHKSITKNLSNVNQTIIICMRLGEPGIPTLPDECIYGRHRFPAASVINNTDGDTSTGLIHVPFPEPGAWFVTMGLFCDGADKATRTTVINSVKDFIKNHITLLENATLPCPCFNKLKFYKKCLASDKCLSKLNQTETLKVKECLMDSKCTSEESTEIAEKFEIHHKLATEQNFATDSACNTSVVFTISSSPCVAGRCGRYGRCYHYMSGGFVFSTCLCIKGYRGWDCTEDSQVPSSFSILLASLLLTLSNLLFIPSIYFAARRKYYTEAVIYFFAMFFSTFYHACDSGEDEYSFCLVKIGVLQFCDFYCGLLAIWVTLIAMAHVRQTFVSLFHMFGAILLAFGTELNKQSLWVFLAPALTGICIISVSWGFKCRKTRKWFPARKYWAVFLPIGAVLVMVGLVCYAFLQTKQNYHIVHSIWHMVMALSILCLLPHKKSFLPKC